MNLLKLIQALHKLIRWYGATHSIDDKVDPTFTVVDEDGVEYKISIINKDK